MRYLAIAMVLSLLAGCGQSPSLSASPVVQAPAPAPKGDPLEGLRVATRVGCNGCHEKDGRGGVFMENP